MSDARELNDFGLSADADDVVRVTYNWSSIAPSTGVVEVVADAVNVDSTALDPLYETIDPDALDQLVRSESERERGDNVAISFEYADCDVTVRGDGSVLVRAGTSESPPD